MNLEFIQRVNRNVKEYIDFSIHILDILALEVLPGEYGVRFYTPELIRGITWQPARRIFPVKSNDCY